jgi:Spy/CpxP family protein refolding chaperone
MQTVRPLLLGGALAALLAGAAPAQVKQPPPKGFPPGKLPPMPLHMLLNHKAVRDDLKLTAQQLPELRQILTKSLEAKKQLFGLPPEQHFPKMQEIDKEGDEAVLAALKSDQAKRLREIGLQQRGVQAFAEPAVADGLKLTSEQRQQVQDILEAAGKEMSKLFQGGRPPAPQVMQTRLAEVNKTSMAKVQRLLTAEQKAQWKEMTGKPFRGVLPPPGPGFGMPPPPGAGAAASPRHAPVEVVWLAAVRRTALAPRGSPNRG